jgi:hypothetical protein
MLYEIRHQEEAEIILLLQLCFVSPPALSFADSVKQPTVKTSRHIQLKKLLFQLSLCFSKY